MIDLERRAALDVVAKRSSRRKAAGFALSPTTRAPIIQAWLTACSPQAVKDIAPSDIHVEVFRKKNW